MPTLTLRLTDKPLVTLPAQLARQAGLQEGDVQVVLGEHSFTVLPIVPPAEYASRWQTLSGALREQAAGFALEPQDHRDAAYWEIVRPLFRETERMTGSV